MKYAIFNGERHTAKPSLIAQCICCGSDVRPYCGEIMVHHWKHVQKRDCDSWFEPETEWHRNWKNHFSQAHQEVVRFDDRSQEKHIADIYLPERKLTLEFQHSPIEIEEIIARESFYKKMIWVIDLSMIAKSLVFHGDTNQIDKIWKKMRKNLPDEFKVDDKFKEEQKDHPILNFPLFNYMSKESRMQSLYISSLIEHYQETISKKDNYLMTWKRAQKRWEYSSMPKFIDIGKDTIYQIIEKVRLGNAYIVKAVDKNRFIQYYKE